MPINRPTVIQRTVWSYRIDAKLFNAHFELKNQRVSAAEPAIHWCIGHRFDKVREICAQRGYTLVNLKEERRKK